VSSKHYSTLGTVDIVQPSGRVDTIQLSWIVIIVQVSRIVSSKHYSTLGTVDIAQPSGRVDTIQLSGTVSSSHNLTSMSSIRNSTSRNSKADPTSMSSEPNSISSCFSSSLIEAMSSEPNSTYRTVDIIRLSRTTLDLPIGSPTKGVWTTLVSSKHYSTPNTVGATLTWTTHKLVSCLNMY
jgi:hypothetical protein